MIPTYCSIREKGRDCINPPMYVISIDSKEGEYLIGVVCSEHKEVINNLIRERQESNLIPDGVIKFEELKYVGTDCISRHIELDK